MIKRIVGKAQYEFIRHEVNYYQETGLIDGDQADGIMELYQVKQGLSFLKIILSTGAVLVGLGVLSFIASNWDMISKLTKYLIILVGFLGVNIVSFLLEENHPKTSCSLIYLGALIYGAGIFLIGQIFNFSGHFSFAFLLWAAGVFPAGLLFRDRIIYLFSSALLLVYVNGCFDSGAWPVAMIFALPALYYCNKYFNYSSLLLFMSNLVALNTIGFLAIKMDWIEIFIVLLFFVTGLVMVYVPWKRAKNVFEIQGNFVVGISGLLLTIPYFWETWGGTFFEVYGQAASIIFTVGFVIYLLYQTKKENLIALIFVCVTIFRYYFDLTYDFLPKSVFFITSGLLLLGFGFYVERQIRRKGGSGDGE